MAYVDWRIEVRPMAFNWRRGRMRLLHRRRTGRSARRGPANGCVIVLESVLRRDRLIVLTALVTVIVACWAYVLDCAGMGMATFERNALIRAPAIPMTTCSGWPWARVRPTAYRTWRSR